MVGTPRARGRGRVADSGIGARTVLRGATVVDTRDGSLTANQDVITADGLIIEITNSDPANVPDGDVVALQDKFVVPGFVDMHAHPLGSPRREATLELMLARGITGFRQMNGSMKLLKQRRHGSLPMPARSPALLELPGAVLTPLNAGNVKAAKATVREQHAAGADFIKVALVSPDVFFAAQAEARRLDTPIVGHLPEGIDVVAASSSGMKSIEHLGPGLPVVAACSTAKQQLLDTVNAKSMPQMPFRIPFSNELFMPLMRGQLLNPLAVLGAKGADVLQRAIDTFSDELAEKLAADFVADGTWHVPTLIREYTCKHCCAPDLQSDPHNDLVDPALLAKWHRSAHRYGELPAGVRATLTESHDVERRLTKIFADAGVSLLAGSDSSGAAWEIPGHALHKEFDAFGQSGLSPLRVLQTTTLAPATFLNRQDTMGTVDTGKDADLVVLERNPIEDVKHLHDVHAVMRAGRLYTGSELDAMTQRIATARSIN